MNSRGIFGLHFRQISGSYVVYNEYFFIVTASAIVISIERWQKASSTLEYWDLRFLDSLHVVHEFSVVSV